MNRRSRFLLVAVLALAAAVLVGQRGRVSPRLYRAIARVYLSNTPSDMAAQLAVLRGDDLAAAVEQLGIPGADMSIVPSDVRVAEVSLVSADPALAARAVNLLADGYVAKMEGAARAETTAMRQQVERELSAQRAAVDRDERHLASVQATMAQLDTTAGMADDLAKEMDAVRKEQQALEPLYREMTTTADLTTVGAVVRDPVIRAKRLHIDDLETLRAALLQRYGDKYPAVRQLDGAIASARADLDALQRRYAALVRSEYENHGIQEQLLGRELTASRADADALARARTEERSLQAALDGDRRLYDALAMKSRDLETAALQQGSGARVIEHAVPPRAPEPIDQTWTWLLAFAGVVSALAAFRRRRVTVTGWEVEPGSFGEWHLPHVTGDERHVA